MQLDIIICTTHKTIEVLGLQIREKNVNNYKRDKTVKCGMQIHDYSQDLTNEIFKCKIY